MIGFRHRRSPTLAFAVVALLLPALVLACGDDDDADATPTTAATSEGTAEATEAAAFPVTVTDLLGREVTIESEPHNIVALSPTAVELVYGVGGSVVGRSSSAIYPPEAESATDVGSAYQPSFDLVLSLNPDLIIADSVIHASPNFRDPIATLGIPVIFAGAESYQQILDGLRVVGAALGANEAAEATILEIEGALATAQEALDGTGVTAVALIADRDQTLYAAKSNSYVGDVMQLLGIENPAAEQPDAGPFPGYSTLAPEVLIGFDPTIVFTITPAPPPAPRLGELFLQIPPFAGLQAVRNGNIVEVDVEIALQAPGPRVVELFAALTAAVAETGS